tara:strand:+ start:1877 stop:2455 length:579 start_codon:yes stop_codon:yes gene_type:complete
MDILKASKKLEEIKVDAYNNLSSGEEESELQLHSATEVPNEDSAAGEEVKPERTKAENVKEYKTLSRTTPMDGKTRAKPEVYLNEEGGKVKKTMSEEIWDKLSDLKKNQGVPWKDQQRTGPSGLPIQRLGSEQTGPPIRQEKFATPEHSLSAAVHQLLQIADDVPFNKPNMTRDWKQLKQQAQQFMDKYKPQ